jgi:hypothetical protein
MKPYTFADWREAHAGQSLFFVQATYAELYPWWQPRRYKLGGWLAECWYYWRCRLWTRYNTIVITTLPPTWTDSDTRILHGMFQILTDFVEIEIPANEHHWWDHSANCTGEAWSPDTDTALAECVGCGIPRIQYEHGAELRALYHWWTVERPAKRQHEADLLTQWAAARPSTTFDPAVDGLSRMNFHHTPESDRLFQEHMAVEAANDAEDEAMLIRLVKIRGSMWT